MERVKCNSQLTEFSYTITESDNDNEPYKYVITYTTSTDVSSMIQGTQISNKVNVNISPSCTHHVNRVTTVC